MLTNLLSIVEAVAILRVGSVTQLCDFDSKILISQLNNKLYKKYCLGILILHTFCHKSDIMQDFLFIIILLNMLKQILNTLKIALPNT